MYINTITNPCSSLIIFYNFLVLEFAQKLESTLTKAESSGIERSHLQLGKDLLSKCQAELHLCTSITRLSKVVCAVDANEHDMKRLKLATQKAEALHVSEELIEEANILSKRLEFELTMTRAIRFLPVKLHLKNQLNVFNIYFYHQSSIPVVRLPPPPVRSKEFPEGVVPEVPEGYWQQSDLGRIIETPEYPKPPIEINGEV